FYSIVAYGVRKDTERIDLDQVRDLARQHRPKLIIAGGSAFPRVIDFKPFGEIAREVGAALMADIAHPAGLVAAGLHPSPVGIADFVTSTTHKTLRGPRGGMVLCGAAHAQALDKTEMAEIARLIDRVLANLGSGAVEAAVRGEVQELTARFPLYPDRTK